jgi:hypothetical protein
MATESQGPAEAPTAEATAPHTEDTLETKTVQEPIEAAKTEKPKRKRQTRKTKTETQTPPQPEPVETQGVIETPKPERRKRTPRTKKVDAQKA